MRAARCAALWWATAQVAAAVIDFGWTTTPAPEAQDQRDLQQLSTSASLQAAGLTSARRSTVAIPAPDTTYFARLFLTTCEGFCDSKFQQVDGESLCYCDSSCATGGDYGAFRLLWIRHVLGACPVAPTLSVVPCGLLSECIQLCLCAQHNRHPPTRLRLTPLRPDQENAATTRSSAWPPPRSPCRRTL
jgi:hypothetical protein